jgi:glycerol-3-phosphate O-acyltransferase
MGASQPILVAPDHSAAWEGLLLALARATGLSGLERIHGAKAPTASSAPSSPEVAPAPTRSVLRWTSLQDQEALLRLIEESEEVNLTTLNVFQLRGPVKALPRHRPGAGWVLGMLLSRRLLTVIIGSNIHVSDARRHGHGMKGVARLRRLLKLDFNRNLKVVRGVPLQPIEEQARTILSGAEFEREVRVLAERAGETVSRMRRRAHSSFYELAAHQRRVMYSVLAFVARQISTRLFTSVSTRGLEQLKESIKDHPVVLVPMHRSHLDYILVQYKLYEAAVNPPLVAAGMNLNFWPVGTITRSVGAFFVKRNARDRLHMLVLRRYVTYLMQRGHSQMFFIEGGRSRSGKMMRPKMGLLSVLFEAYRKGIRKDILFIPVSISYEQVIEDQEFGTENTGRSKTKENLVSLFHALDIFKKKYGEVIINFGDPLPVSKFLGERSPSAEAKSTPTNGRSEERTSVQELGLTLVRGIRNHISPSLTNLAYSSLMMAPYYGLPRSVLAESVRNLASLLSAMRKGPHCVGEFTPSLQRFVEGRDAILNDLPREGIVEVDRCLAEEVFFIPGKRRFTADFYRNTLLHLFFPVSALAILELMGKELSGQNTLFLHRYFAQDLLLPKEEVFAQGVDALIELFVSEGILTRSANPSVPDSTPNLRFTKRARGLFIPSMLSGPIESILWVWQNLLHHTETQVTERTETGEKSFLYASFIKALHADFRAARYVGAVHRTEAAALSSLQSALDVLSERGIISTEEKNGQKHRIILKDSTTQDLNVLSEAHKAVRLWESGL